MDAVGKTLVLIFEIKHYFEPLFVLSFKQAALVL